MRIKAPTNGNFGRTINTSDVEKVLIAFLKSEIMMDV